MKPICVGCKNIIQDTIKLHVYNKKIGNKCKSIIEYYCETCFFDIDKEKSWNVHREKEEFIKKQNIKRSQR